MRSPQQLPARQISPGGGGGALVPALHMYYEINNILLDISHEEEATLSDKRDNQNRSPYWTGVSIQLTFMHVVDSVPVYI